MRKVTILPNREQIEVSGELNLFRELRSHKYPIQTTCGGVGTCGRCVVVVKEGEENLSPITFSEKKLLGNVYYITHERLSCQCEVRGDVTVDISIHLDSKENKKATKVIRKTKKEVEEEKELVVNNYKNEDRKDNLGFNKTKKLGGSKKPKTFHYRNPQEEE